MILQLKGQLENWRVYVYIIFIKEEKIYSHLDGEKALDEIQHPFSVCGYRDGGTS